MTNESLEVVRCCPLRLIVPKLQQVVLSASKHEATIECQVSGCDCALVNCIQFSDERTIERCQFVKSDPLVLGHNNELAIVLGELEAADDCAHVDLMLQDDRIRYYVRCRVL